MGGVAKAINPRNILRGTAAAASFGTSELLQKRPFGLVNNPTGLGMFGDRQNQENPYIPGPFSLDPEQVAADKAAITGLGDTQFGETTAFNATDKVARENARQRLSEALIKQSQDSFKQGMAGTLEDLNARNLANGSGVGQEFARQQADIATNIANQVGVVGANDINRSSDLGLGALQQRQGIGQSALSRGFSLEDFIRQANVAKIIGAQTAPQVGNGKGQTGTLLGGIGALAPIIGAAKGFGKGGPAGAVAGATLPGMG